ncbi:recombination protein [Lactobacillus pasteurii DSM 23907 = CRBIP 24.76]|nr:recombination protein [Lactobacillus pasteurii DSM 23907 = CRBIP 24.76]
MKNGQRYNYKYADLAGVDKAIQQAVNQVRDKDGLPCLNYSVDAGIDIDGIWAETLVIDSSGCAVKLSKLWFKSANVGNAQSSASLLSYAKRYSLSASFGIASEDDDDAQQFVNNQPEQPEQPQAHYLNDSELNSYMVVYAGRRLKLADLMQDAIDGDKDVQNWIKSERDPQTVIAIKQLSDIYKRSAKKVEPKPEPVEQKTEDKTIKELVDGHEPENPENLFDGLE